MAGAEGMNPRKVRIIDLVLALAVTISGAAFFLFFTRAVNGDAYSVWIVPMTAATVFVALLSVFGVAVGSKKMITPIVIIAFLPSIIFMPTIWHMTLTVMMAGIAVHGLHGMRRTLFNMNKINMTTIVRSGISYVSIAIVIVITSQYYYAVRGGVADTVFDASGHVKFSNMAADFILARSNIDDVSVGTMTVDDFLYVVVENAYTDDAAGGMRVPVESDGALLRWANSMEIDLAVIESDAEAQVVDQMRENISTMLGRSVAGDEMIIDAFSEIVETQVNNAIEQNQVFQQNRAEIFAVLFFLVIFSLASIIRTIAGWLARFIFMLLRETKKIKVIKIERDVEVISM